MPFGDFMNEFVDKLMENCFKAHRKPDFTKAISKINWAIKAKCYFSDIKKWLLMFKNIISKALFQRSD